MESPCQRGTLRRLCRLSRAAGFSVAAEEKHQNCHLEPNQELIFETTSTPSQGVLVSKGSWQKKVSAKSVFFVFRSRQKVILWQGKAVPGSHRYMTLTKLFFCRVSSAWCSGDTPAGSDCTRRML